MADLVERALRQADVTKSLIAEAITAYFGERCPDFDEGCVTCDVWARFDALTSASEENELLRSAHAEAVTDAQKREDEAGRLREALTLIENECDPNDPPWRDPEHGRVYCGNIAREALSTRKGGE